MNLSLCETVTDLKKAIKSHTDIVNGNSSESVKQPYRDRLEKLNELK
ncbi:DUF6965 family protein [Leeuwenhoekiella aequorea]